MIVVFLLLAVVLISLFSWIVLIKDCKNYNIPGPRPLPIIGNGHLFLGKANELLPLLRNLMLEYGDVVFVHLLHVRYLMLSHPKYVEPLISNPELIAKGKSYSYLQPWLGNGLLTSTGHRWRNTRKFLTPAFHFNILHNFLPVFLKNEKILIEKLHEYADGRSFNAMPIMALTALDNVTESIMGVSVDAQRNSESKYVKSIETLAHIVSLRMRNLFMAEDVIFNLSSQKKQQDEALEFVHSHTKKVITMRREELKRANITKLNENENENKNENESENGHSDIGIKNKHAFLDLLLLAEVDGEKIKDDHVREEVDTFMFEGHDTTASGLTFALYCISKRPDVQQKIIEEQKNVLGEDLNRDPTYSDLQQMKYLDLVIRESLRLYPSVPLIERMITEDAQASIFKLLRKLIFKGHVDYLDKTDISSEPIAKWQAFDMNSFIMYREVGEIKIRKNTSVVINILELQRHPGLYDNPMEFDPERFNTISANSSKNAFSWLAFSAGPRNCIGQKFAMLELKVTVAGIVKHFHVLPDNLNQPVLCAELILRSESGVPIKLKPRKIK